VAAEDESRGQPQPSLYLGVEVDEIIHPSNAPWGGCDGRSRRKRQGSSL